MCSRHPAGRDDQGIEQCGFAPDSNLVELKHHFGDTFFLKRTGINADMLAVGSNDAPHRVDLLGICCRSKLHGHSSQNDPTQTDIRVLGKHRINF